MQRRTFLGWLVGAISASPLLVRYGQAAAALTEAQRADIFFMFQEEKVARDVYLTLGKLYPAEGTFGAIPSSEQSHMNAVKRLCDRYGIDVSGVPDDLGVFVLPELQAMYDELVARGSRSLLEALRVGEYIEITDIADLEERMVGMPRDVFNVFSNLKAGSENHLAAFQSAIARETG